MTETANPELCRELYELSGWETEYYYYKKLNFDLSYLVTKGPLSSFTFKGSDPFSAIPAYTLGYLLRRLPIGKWFQGKDGLDYLFQIEIKSGVNPNEWCAWQSINLHEDADTPENAAAKLAIELFKNNVLTREG